MYPSMPVDRTLDGGSMLKMNASTLLHVNDVSVQPTFCNFAGWVNMPDNIRLPRIWTTYAG